MRENGTGNTSVRLLPPGQYADSPSQGVQSMVAVAKIKKSKSFLQTFDEMRNENRGEEFLSKHDITLMEVLELKRQLKWNGKKKVIKKPRRIKLRRIKPKGKKPKREKPERIKLKRKKPKKRKLMGKIVIHYFSHYQESAGQNR